MLVLKLTKENIDECIRELYKSLSDISLRVYFIYHDPEEISCSHNIGKVNNIEPDYNEGIYVLLSDVTIPIRIGSVVIFNITENQIVIRTKDDEISSEFTIIIYLK